MADTGYRSPGTMGVDPAVGTKNWVDPDNAKVSDNVYAVSSGGKDGGDSYYLKATNFGFSIPAGATINGILVQFERKPGGVNIVTDWKVYIVKETGAYGTENKNAGEWAVPEAYYSYGGAADLWSEAWTPAKINDADFGVVISVILGIFTFADVDHIRIKVYYTEPSTNMKINIGYVFKDVDEIKINIADVWKPVTGTWINIGDVWRTIFG